MTTPNSSLDKALPWSLTAGLGKVIRAVLGERDETAMPLIREMLTFEIGEDFDFEELRFEGGFKHADGGYCHYEPDAELRDFENVLLKEDINEYFAREVLPHVPDAWMDRTKDKVGYEISFTKYFYEYKPLRSTVEIAAELLKLDEETENLLREIVQV
jgi:hypothetical protein